MLSFNRFVRMCQSSRVIYICVQLLDSEVTSLPTGQEAPGSIPAFGAGLFYRETGCSCPLSLFWPAQITVVRSEYTGIVV